MRQSTGLNTLFAAGICRALRTLVITAVTISTLAAAADISISPDAPAALPQKKEPSRNQAARSSKPAAKPLWHELTFAQQTALAPLSAEWNTLEASRKQKWLVLANKYASMKPEEQQRMQERMRDWVSLTPAQRRIARESYARAKKLDAEQKTEQWRKYQELSEEQKQKLAAKAQAKNPVATLPTTAQRKTTPVQPIKSTPKPVLEQSVTPQAAKKSALKPSPTTPTQ